VRCDKDPKESTVQKIIDFVKNAQDDEPAVQSRINKIEKVYVYVVILLALAYMIIPPLFGWWSSEVAFQRGLIVLVVGSPCALVASITPGYLASISHASRKKVLIKGGSILEEIKDIQCVIFDKTGTLTKGKPTVQTHYIDPDKNALFPLFLGMEKASNHPLAKAIFEAFKDEDMIDCAPLEIPGKGLELEFNGHLYQVGKFDHVLPSNIKKTIDPLIKEGASMVVLFEDQVCVGYFSLIDEVKTEAKALITYLKSHNIYTVMVSGDLIETAQHISEKIEIDAFHGECLPGDKVDWVKHYQKKYQKVMMIGDGINDAPALTLADIAIAMGSGTDVSLESSDIVMMDSQLKGIELTFDLSNRLKKITTMNVLFSISVIGVMLLFNTFGWVLLPVGVVIHEVSTIIVILNSLRLLA
jgi:Cd2+/Zn2+-exporting ATPase